MHIVAEKQDMFLDKNIGRGIKEKHSKEIKHIQRYLLSRMLRVINNF